MIYLELFFTFLKTGLFTFGGGYAMLPLVQGDVLSHGWMTQEEIIDFIAVSESTPGPLAVNMSTYVGRVTAGIPGALMATSGVILPSFIIILIVAGFYKKFRSSRIISGSMSGLRPAVIGLIASALVSIGRAVFLPAGVVSWLNSGLSVCIFLVMTVLAFKKLHPILIISLSGAVGIALGYTFGL